MPDRDKRKIRQAFSAAAESYDSMARLQKQVVLDLIDWAGRPEPEQRVLDLGCGTGFLTEQLAGHVIALDMAWPMVAKTRQKLPWQNLHCLCADAEALPFTAGCFDQVYSSLALQWCRVLPSVFSDIYRVLKPQGRLVFSSFGPNSLHELKTAWRRVDHYPHVNTFQSVEAVECALSQAGFDDIELDCRTYTLQYADVWALMRELKGIGARHVHSRNSQRLTTRKQLMAMQAAYPRQSNGKIAASYEIILGRAK